MARNHYHFSLYYFNHSLGYTRFFNRSLVDHISKRVSLNSLKFEISQFSGFSYATDGTIALFIGLLPLVLHDKNPFQGIILFFFVGFHMNYFKVIGNINQYYHGIIYRKHFPGVYLCYKVLG
jgi:hypothetical protein